MQRKIVSVSYCHDKQKESSIWLYRIIERILLDQLLNADPCITSILLSESLTEFEEENTNVEDFYDDVSN
ncbi:hypothetical protein B4U37_02965 [Sutcliffiella horikoshii]|uniref:Uncharacterized protein n=2 Tax=Sutcliffiella horikoshii TaxID=79883 RepID=A0ABN4Z9X3_9BACI|nr:hypothetical protein B4U37_02965 [Sutcliffiella horikoshii]